MSVAGKDGLARAQERSADASGREAFLKLAERCEREGPSRELDGAIAVATGDYSAASPTGYKSEGYLWRDTSGHAAPAYTTSLDAAVTLEPKDAQEIVVRVYPKGVYVRITLANNAVAYCEGFGNEKLTEPMARCAAALRARASLLA